MKHTNTTNQSFILSRNISTLAPSREISERNKFKKDKYVNSILLSMNSVMRWDFHPILIDNLDLDTRYVYLIKICYKSLAKTGRQYVMCGPQSSFYYTKVSDIALLLEDIKALLEISLSDYNLMTNDILYVELSFIKLDEDIVDKYKLTEVEKNVIDSHMPSSRSNFDLGIPYLSDALKVGKLLDGAALDDFISKVINKSEMLSMKNPNKLLGFNSNQWVFYENFIDNRKYIYGYNNFHDLKVEKIRFSITGTVLSRVIDIMDSDRNVIKSIQGKHTIYYDLNNNKTRIETEINLSPIPASTDVTQYISDPNFGVFDFEVYKDSNGNHIVYSIAFKTALDKDVITYYITDYSDSQDMLMHFINKIMSYKYNNITFYCHNGGKYDFIWLVTSVLRHNHKVSNKDVYSTDYSVIYGIDSIFRGNRILTLKVKDTTNKNRHVTMRDSYAVLNSSLRDLCKSYELTQFKGIFPYRFVRDDTLLYKGIKPDISYYDNVTLSDYNEIPRDDWSTKDTTLEYITQDVICLYNVIDKFNAQLFDDYDMSITDRPTITGLATKHFMNFYYKDNIPLINNTSLYNDIHNSYYGGITEVYKPYGKDLFYYDVNSLYPFVALNSLPGVGTCTKLSLIEGDIKHLNNIFGFFYCEVETPKDGYIGLLPVRDEKEGLIFPLGKFSGWYFSEELKFAAENGYKIRVLYGYQFKAVKNVFNAYISKVFDKKINSKNNVQKTVAKSMLNNLLGRFGINLYKSKTEIVDFKTFNTRMAIYPVDSYIVLDKDHIIISYKNYIDTKLVENNKLDLNKIMKDYPNNKEIERYSLTSVSTSAAITAYARIHMCKLKLNILSKGGKIYYSDTDSIVTDMELPKDMISKDELGKLKLEYKVKLGIFVAGKTYYITADNNIVVKKAKGITADNLTKKDYMKLIKEGALSLDKIKKTSNINWSKGEVTIDTIDTILNPFKVNKRTKVFKSGNNSIWTDTKPLTIERNSFNNKSGFFRGQIRSMSTYARNVLNKKRYIYNPFRLYMFYIMDIYKILCLFIMLILVLSSVAVIINSIENYLGFINNITDIDNSDNNHDTIIMESDIFIEESVKTPRLQNHHLLDMGNYPEGEFDTPSIYVSEYDDSCTNNTISVGTNTDCNSYVDKGTNTSTNYCSVGIYTDNNYVDVAVNTDSEYTSTELTVHHSDTDESITVNTGYVGSTREAIDRFNEVNRQNFEYTRRLHRENQQILSEGVFVRNENNPNMYSHDRGIMRHVNLNTSGLNLSDDSLYTISIRRLERVHNVPGFTHVVSGTDILDINIDDDCSAIRLCNYTL